MGVDRRGRSLEPYFHKTMVITKSVWWKQSSKVYMDQCLEGVKRISYLGEPKKKASSLFRSFYTSLVPCNAKEFPLAIVWNSFKFHRRLIFSCLGNYLVKNNNPKSTKKKGLIFT